MNLVAFYESVTLALGTRTGASDQLLHVHAGMAILLVARLISGRSLGSGIPFVPVFVLALGNELLDRINYGKFDWPDLLTDLLATWFWPLVLTAASRFRPPPPTVPPAPAP